MVTLSILAIVGMTYKKINLTPLYLTESSKFQKGSEIMDIFEMYQKCDDFRDYVTRFKNEHYPNRPIEEVLEIRIVKDTALYYLADGRLKEK